MNRLALWTIPGFISVDTIEPGAMRVGAIRFKVTQGCAVTACVPLFAAGHAGLASDAGIEIDDEAELLADLPDVLRFGAQFKNTDMDAEAQT